MQEAKPAALTRWILPLGIIAWCITAVLWVPQAFPFHLVSFQLQRWGVITLELTSLIALLGLVLEFRAIKELVLELSKRTKVLLVLLAVATLLLSNFLAPRTNRILYDEHIYESIGQSIAHTGRSQMCNNGFVVEGEFRCSGGEYNKEPNGYPYFLAQFFRLFGVTEGVAHFANTVAHMLGALAAFWVAYLLFAAGAGAGAAEGIGLLAMAILALTPVALRWSNTTASESSSLCFAAIAVASAAYYVRRRTIGALMIAVAFVVLGMQFRIESLLVVAPVGLVLWSGLGSREMISKRMLWAYAGAAALLVVAGIHMLIFRGNDWGAQGAKLSVDFFWNNLRVNGLFYFLNERYPLLFTLAALSGLAIGFKRHFFQTLTLATWFFCFWGIFLSFYAGSYDYGADVRFSMVSAVPLAVLAGFGAWSVGTWLQERFGTEFSHAVIIVLLAANAFMFLPMISTIGEEARDARADIYFAREERAKLPEDSLVFSHMPTLWLMLKQSSAQTSIASGNASYVRDNLFQRHSGGLFFHWNYWCNLPIPVQANLCYDVLKLYKNVLIREQKVFNKRFALYRLFPDMPEPSPSPVAHK